MSKKLKRRLKNIIIGISLFLVVFITNLVLEKAFGNNFPNGLASIIPNENFGWLLPFGLYFAIYIFIGHDVVKKAFLGIGHGQLLDENFLMTVATIGAFGLGIYTGIVEHNPEGFDEACAVLLFYQVGEWFQSYALGKARKSITGLMDIRPDYANLRLEDGSFDMVDPSEVKVGDVIQVLPGEKIPLDGVVVKGTSTLDTKALTGESLPAEVSVGSNVISGTINLTGTIEVEVLKEFGESTVSKILDLVENASAKKSRSENFITKFSKVYTPIVVFSAIALAILPTIIIGLVNNDWQWATWIYRALSFLVVSCPCALVISIPLSFFAGIGGASSQGILVKGSVYLEQFAKANIFVFDKTGTLTKGNFAVASVYPEEKKDELLHLAAIAEAKSNHPIATSIVATYGKEVESTYTLENIAGKGIKAVDKDDVILCGNDKLMEAFGISYKAVDEVGTIVYVARNNKFEGYIVIADEIKDEAIETINTLNSLGCKTVMLTGDNDKIASSVAKKLGLTDYKAGLLPQNKVEEVDKLLETKKDNDVLCFVGDGINDAPVLMKSDIGVSMGGVGSDAAIEASDIVLMHDDLKCLGKAKKIANKTLRIVFENIVFAIGVKILILILTALGFANMWIAIFGDVGVAILAILNAMRCNTKK